MTTVLRATYRGRLLVEGGVLAACGVVGSAVLVVAVNGAKDNATSTVVQLLVVLVLLGVFAPLGAVRAMRAAVGIREEEAGDGEPTPLWQLPAIVVVLAGVAGLAVGWDAGLRVTGGCVLVGLAQALLLARLVAARERRDDVTFVRLPGSRILRGTRLGRVAR